MAGSEKDVMWERPCSRSRTLNTNRPIGSRATVTVYPSTTGYRAYARVNGRQRSGEASAEPLGGDHVQAPIIAGSGMKKPHDTAPWDAYAGVERNGARTHRRAGSHVAGWSRRSLMKALVATRYGSPAVLQVQDVARPTPKDHDIVVEVHAVSVNAADVHLLSGKPFLVRPMGYGLLKLKNRILGADIAGRVDAVGRNVTQFKPGDEVFGNLATSGWGGFAEYVCACEDALVVKPSRLSFAEAAAVPMAAVTAL